MDAYDKAVSLARGSYQRSIARGDAALSGPDLRGEAKNWGAKYARSRASFLARVSEAGIWVITEGGTSHTGPRRIVGYEWTAKGGA